MQLGLSSQLGSTSRRATWTTVDKHRHGATQSFCHLRCRPFEMNLQAQRERSSHARTSLGFGTRSAASDATSDVSRASQISSWTHQQGSHTSEMSKLRVRFRNDCVPMY